MRFKIILNIVIIAVAIVCVWRGVWGLLDIYLFPDALVLSFVVSICIGVGILFLLGPRVFRLLAG